MTRRASLPGADELFKQNSPALSAVREMAPETSTPAATPAATPTPRAKKGVRSIPRRRLAVDRGRIVRESIAVIIADLEQKGDQSILARRLRGI